MKVISYYSVNYYRNLGKFFWITTRAYNKQITRYINMLSKPYLLMMQQVSQYLLAWKFQENIFILWKLLLIIVLITIEVCIIFWIITRYCNKHIARLINILSTPYLLMMQQISQYLLAWKLNDIFMEVISHYFVDYYRILWKIFWIITRACNKHITRFINILSQLYLLMMKQVSQYLLT